MKKKMKAQESLKPVTNEHPSMAEPLATCELCRADGGCLLGFRAKSPLPKAREKDSELRVGRTTLYSKMSELVNGVPKIEYYDVGGGRMMLGASKCRYAREHLNRPGSKRGGRRGPQKPGSKPSQRPAQANAKPFSAAPIPSARPSSSQAPASAATVPPPPPVQRPPAAPAPPTPPPPSQTPPSPSP